MGSDPLFEGSIWTFCHKIATFDDGVIQVVTDYGIPRHIMGTSNEIRQKIRKDFGRGMFIEGYIDKDYLDMIKTWGHEPDWECHTEEEAKAKGYENVIANKDGSIRGGWVIIRIWVDSDVHSLFPPEDMAKDDKGLLPMMVVNGNKIIREYAEKALKESSNE